MQYVKNMYCNIQKLQYKNIYCNIFLDTQNILQYKNIAMYKIIIAIYKNIFCT